MRRCLARQAGWTWRGRPSEPKGGTFIERTAKMSHMILLGRLMLKQAMRREAMEQAWRTLELILRVPSISRR